MNQQPFVELARTLNKRDEKAGFIVVCRGHITEFNFTDDTIFRCLDIKLATDKEFLPKLCDYVLDKYNENK